MAEPTLAQIFGEGASQDGATLTISKTALASSVELIASANNSAESLLAAILAHAQKTLTAANQDTNPDQSIVIENNLDSLVTRNDVTYRRKSKSIDFDKLDNNSTFKPSDY